MGPAVLLPKILMPCLVAEMRHVDHRRRVIRQNLQNRTRLQGFQPLARFQHGQGAQQPDGIQGFFDLAHVVQISGKFQAVHKDVTTGRVTLADCSNKSRGMFGIEIIDAGLLPAMLVALLGGVISFLSPCVLPIVPPYLAYMSGVTIGEMQGTVAARRKAIIAALFFVLGLSTVFLLLGFTASAFGAFVLQNQELFAQVSGVVVIIFGLHFLSVFRIPLLDREARMEAGESGGSALGAYVLGLAFAFGWTPCIGPQLGAILSLAASEASVSRGTILLGVYAAGLGVPFLLAAIFLNRSMVLMNRMKRHMGVIEKAMGGLLLFVGVMLVTGLFTTFSWWLLETFPALAVLG